MYSITIIVTNRQYSTVRLIRVDFIYTYSYHCCFMLYRTFARLRVVNAELEEIIIQYTSLEKKNIRLF